MYFSNNKIPTVSLKNVIRENSNPIIGHSKEWKITAEELGTALRSTGFVYLIDHGIPEHKIKDVFDASVTYFKLPVGKKEKYPRDFNKSYHGYTKIGEEMFSKNVSTELRETFDVSLQNRCELFYPNEEVPQLKSTTLSLIEECNSVAKVILKLLPIAIGLQDDEVLCKYHNIIDDQKVDNYSQLRTLYYPEITGLNGVGKYRNAEPEMVRCGAHTDFGTFTLLFQDSMGGLEVKKGDDGWLPATPMSGAVLMNTADLLHVWSAGSFPSTLHRVIVPEEEYGRRIARQSIAYFLKPDNVTVVTPLMQSGNHIEFNRNNIDCAINAGDHFRRRTTNHRNKS